MLPFKEIHHRLTNKNIFTSKIKTVLSQKWDKTGKSCGTTQIDENHPLVTVLTYGLYCNGYTPSTATHKMLSVALISPFTKFSAAAFHHTRLSKDIVTRLLLLITGLTIYYMITRGNGFVKNFCEYLQNDLDLFCICWQ